MEVEKGVGRKERRGEENGVLSMEVDGHSGIGVGK